MAITLLQPFNFDTTANYTFNSITVSTGIDLSSTGNVNLGNVSNLRISGGSANYVLKTDGAGNLSWVAQSGGTGTSISNGTSNINIATSGGNVTTSVNGNADILIVTGTGVNVSGTFNSTGNGNLGNIGATGGYFTTVGGSLTTASQPNITSVGTLSSLDVTGNITSGNANLGNAVVANYFVGNGSLLTGLSATANGGNATNLVNGTSNVIVTSSGNIAFSVAGNSNIEVITGTGVNIAGYMNATGNVTGNYILGNGFFLSGVDAAGRVVNGTSNLNIATSGGNITLSVAGNANILTVTGTGVNVAGTMTATGNVTGNYILGNGFFLSGVDAAGRVVNGTSNLNIATSGGNVTMSVGGTTNVEVVTSTGVNIAGYMTATGNVTGGNLLGRHANGNSNVFIPAANGNVTISVGGTTNVEVVTSTGVNIAGYMNASGNVTGNYILGNGFFLSGVDAAGRVVNGTSNLNIATSGGNITLSVNGTANVMTVSNTTVAIANTANISNLIVTGTANFASTSNVNLGNVSNLSISGGLNGYVLGTDGSGTLSWVLNGGGVTAAQIGNGSSNVSILIAGGPVTFGVNTTDNVFVVNETYSNFIGNVNIAGNVVAGNANISGDANINGNINLGNGSGGTLYNLNLLIANYISGVLRTDSNSQPNITSVGNLTNLTVTGNTTSANFIGVYANGNSNVNIPAANGNITLSVGGTANVEVVTSTGVNIAGYMTATGNVTGANLLGRLANGNSNVNIPASNGNVTISAIGNANIVVITGTGANITGTANITGIANLGANLNVVGNIAGGNANLGNLTTANYFAGTLTTAAQPNITSVGTLSNLTVGPNSNIILSGTSGFVRANSIQGVDGTVSLFTYYGNVGGAAGVRTSLTVGTSGVGNLVVSNGNAIFGNVDTISIQGGSNGNALCTYGNGTLYWGAGGGGGGGGANLTLSDVTTNATFYPVFANANSGLMSTAYLNSSLLTYNPNSGTLTAQDFNTLSDVTLKDNVEPIEDPFTILNKLFGVGFNWKNSGKKSYGLIAQMLETVLPELVSTTPDGKKSVNYIPIIAFLLEAVKKQQEDIDDLKKQKR